MRLANERLLLLVSAILGAIPYSMAMDMDMGSEHHHSTASANVSSLIPVAHEASHHHGLPILQMDLTPAERLYWENYNTTTFFTLDTPYHSYLLVHFGFSILSLFFLYPISLVLNNVDSNWYLPSLTLNNGVLTVSLFCYMIFKKNVEELYPGNVYGKMGIILFVVMLIHYLSAIVKSARQYMQGSSLLYEQLQTNKPTYIPMTDYQMDGSQSPASTLFDHNRSSSSRGNSSDFNLEEDSVSLTEANVSSKSKFAALRDNLLNKVFRNQVVSTVSDIFGKLCEVLFTLINFVLLVYQFVYFVTGVSVLNLLGKDHHVFNLLAHFIKGGVFFGLGVLSLVRYLGSFQKAGLGWNYSFMGKYEPTDSIYLREQSNTSMLTMEMIESSLILFYGSTNVFLEHLAAPGGAWTAKDLQHVSIAFMFIGCGLCGVLTEIKLSSWRREKFEGTLLSIEPSTGISKIDMEAIRTCTPGFSPNPFPAFTIFFTGLLMSLHLQASQLSTQIHIQWGNLLTYGSCVRMVTILLMLFWKHNSYESLFKPVRPFTELITSFCLLAGGLVFMESTDPVIEAMEYRGFTSMFSLNVSVGFVTLFMGWIMLLFAFKDHLKAKF